MASPAMLMNEKALCFRILRRATLAQFQESGHETRRLPGRPPPPAGPAPGPVIPPVQETASSELLLGSLEGLFLARAEPDEVVDFVAKVALELGEISVLDRPAGPE
jgi:hypothetical protein